MAEERIGVILDVQANMADVLGKVRNLQDAFKNIKMPDNLKSQFAKSFDGIEDKAKKINNILSGNVKTKGQVDSINKNYSQLMAEYQNIVNNMQKITPDMLKIDTSSIAGYKELTEQLKTLEAELDQLKAKKFDASSIFENVSKSGGLGKTINEIKELEQQFNNTGDIEAFGAALDKIYERMSTRKVGDEVGFGTYKNAEAANAIKEYIENWRLVSTNLADVQAKVEGTKSKMEGLAGTARSTQLNTLNAEAEKTSESLQKMGTSLTEAAQQSVSFNSTMQQLSSYASRIFSVTAQINLMKRALREAVSTVKELDASMTETAVVTDYSVSDMWAQLPEYTKRAQDLGVTINDTYQAATLYYQQGLDTKAVEAVSEQTLKMARISGLEAAQATDAMTAALRGFNMEVNQVNAQKINDVFSNLAANSASNVQELSTAMEKVASIANSAGMSFENTSAFLAQIIETTRESAETAGTALKTVIARFSEVKKLYTEGQLTGSDEEGSEIDVNKIDTALKTAGIDMHDYFLGKVGLDDIFMELAQKWDSLTKVQQRYIATQAAGSRQQSRFIALMSDYARTQELVGYAVDAEGASQEQFDKTLEGLDAKLNRLSDAWQTFLMSIANSDVIKGAVDGLTTLVNGVNKLIDSLSGGNGVVKSLMSLFTMFSTLKMGGKLFASTMGGIGGAFMANSTFAEGFSSIWNTKGLLGSLFASTTLGGKFVKAISSDTEKGMTQGGEAAFQGMSSNAGIVGGFTRLFGVSYEKAADIVAKNPIQSPEFLEKKEIARQYYQDSGGYDNLSEEEYSTQYALRQTGQKQTAQIQQRTAALTGSTLALSLAAKGLSVVFDKLGNNNLADTFNNISMALGGLTTAFMLLNQIAPQAMAFLTGNPLIAAGVVAATALVAGAYSAYKHTTYSYKKEQFDKSKSDYLSQKDQLDEVEQKIDEKMSSVQDLAEKYNIKLVTDVDDSNLDSTIARIESAPELKLADKEQLRNLKKETIELRNQEKIQKRITDQAQSKAETDAAVALSAKYQSKEHAQYTEPGLNPLDQMQAAIQGRKLAMAKLEENEEKFARGELSEQQYEGYKNVYTKELEGYEALQADIAASLQEIQEGLSPDSTYARKIDKTLTDFALQDAGDFEILSSKLGPDLLKTLFKSGKGIDFVKNRLEALGVTAESLGVSDESLNEYLKEVEQSANAASEAIEEVGFKKLGYEDFLKALETPNQDEIWSKISGERETMTEYIKDHKYGLDDLQAYVGLLTNASQEWEDIADKENLAYSKAEFYESKSGEAQKLAEKYFKDDKSAYANAYAALEKKGYFNKDGTSTNLLKDSRQVAKALAEYAGVSDMSLDAAEAVMSLMETFGADWTGVIKVGEGLAEYNEQVSYYEELINNIDDSNPLKKQLQEQLDAFKEGANEDDYLDLKAKLDIEVANAEQWSDFFGLSQTADLTGSVEDRAAAIIAGRQAIEGTLSGLDKESDAYTALSGRQQELNQLYNDYVDAVKKGDLESQDALYDQLDNKTKEFITAKENIDNYDFGVENFNHGGGFADELKQNWTSFVDFASSNGIDLSTLTTRSDWEAVWDEFKSYAEKNGIELEGVVTPETEEPKSSTPAASAPSGTTSEKKEYKPEKGYTPTPDRNDPRYQDHSENPIYDWGSGKRITPAEPTAKPVLSEMQNSIASVASAAQANSEEYLPRIDEIKAKVQDALTGAAKDADISDLGVNISDDIASIDVGSLETKFQQLGLDEAQINSQLDSIAESAQVKLSKDVQITTYAVQDGKLEEQTQIVHLEADNTADLTAKTQAAIDAVNTQNLANAIADALSTIKIEADPSQISEASAAVQELSDKISAIPDAKFSISPGQATVQAIAGAVSNLIGQLNSLNGKVVTYTINKQGDGHMVNGTAHLHGSAYADGTPILDSWKTKKDQSALVGELGQEMVVHGNEWWTVGDSGPEFTSIPAGSVVFNHKQTRDLLTKGFTNNRGRALMHGTAFYRAPTPQHMNISAGSGKAKASSSGGKASGDKGWENSIDKLYNLLEEIDEALATRERLERDYDRILKNRNRSASEVIKNANERVKLLEQEIKLQEKLKQGRADQLKNIGSETWMDKDGNKKTYNSLGMGQYAWYDFDKREINIDWAKINKVNNKDTGAQIEQYLKRLEELSKDYEKTYETIEDMYDEIQEIKELGKKEYLDLEDRVYDALVTQQKNFIDEMSDINDSIGDVNSDILDALKKQIELERQIRDNTKKENEIAEKERQLAYLRRDTSGANATQIKKLEEDLAKSREDYEDELVDQAIDKLKDDSDEAKKQRDRQIQLMEKQLEWMEETGGFWERVYELIKSGTDSNGNIKNQSELIDLLKEVDKYFAKSEIGQLSWTDEFHSAFKEALIGLENWGEELKEDLDTTVKTATTEKSGANNTENNWKGIALAMLTSANAGGWGYEADRDRRLEEKGLDSHAINEWINAMAQLAKTHDIEWLMKYFDVKGAMSNYKYNAFATGGLADFTGPAWLDGSKTRPEMVLNPADTKNLIQLKDILASILTSEGGGDTVGGTAYFDFTINVDSIGSDYDVDQMIDRISKNLYDKSKYRNVNAINLLR